MAKSTSVAEMINSNLMHNKVEVNLLMKVWSSKCKHKFYKGRGEESGLEIGYGKVNFSCGKDITTTRRLN